MRTAIYARVSTTDKGQDPELQLRPLLEYCLARGWNVIREFTDYCSGAKDTRPKLSELMTDARRRSIDCIVVWKLDRFGRSLKHLITALDELKHLGVSVCIASGEFRPLYTRWTAHDADHRGHG